MKVARLGPAGPDLAHRTLAVRRTEHTHLVCFDDLSTDLVTGRLRDTGRVRPGRAAATADRILDEAREVTDPVHLFGVHPAIAVKCVHAAHPDKALPRIR
ncbi:hypothetical protein OHA02_24555 [Streptomyces phaeochromogenes]|nr:hypothetical protein [Streptomyces phaeochromogenes]